MSNTEQKIAEEAWSQKLDRARERIGTLREEKGDRELVAAHASKGAIPRKEIEALRWLISQRFVVPETDNVQFALVISLLQRLSQLPTPATASDQCPYCQGDCLEKARQVRDNEERYSASTLQRRLRLGYQHAQAVFEKVQPREPDSSPATASKLSENWGTGTWSMEDCKSQLPTPATASECTDVGCGVCAYCGERIGKPDSASTGKALAAKIWTTGVLKSKDPELFLKLANIIDEHLAATPSGGAQEKYALTTEELVINFLRGQMSYTSQDQEILRKFMRYLSQVPSFPAPSGGAEKWTWRDYVSKTLVIGVVSKRTIGQCDSKDEAENFCREHNATLQPQDDTKRLDWYFGNQATTVFFDKNYRVYCRGKVGIGKTIREAIDASMRKEAK